MDSREEMGGKAMLDSLAEFKFPEGEPENTKRLSDLLKLEASKVKIEA